MYNLKILINIYYYYTCCAHTILRSTINTVSLLHSHTTPSRNRRLDDYKPKECATLGDAVQRRGSQRAYLRQQATDLSDYVHVGPVNPTGQCAAATTTATATATTTATSTATATAIGIV